MQKPYDIAVIGGGITGAGVARDAALRGLKVALFERHEPGLATTAASTHLIHGGVRYLLYDRLTTHATCWDSGHIVRTASHLLKRLPILWPVYRHHSRGMETVETLFEQYDLFQPMKYGRSHLRVSASTITKMIPGLKEDGLLGGLLFDEWWVDATSLVKETLESAKKAGADIFINTPTDSLLKEGRRIVGLKSGSNQHLARITINAAGPWVDKVASLSGSRLSLRLMKGTHLIWKDPHMVEMGLLLEAEDRNRYVFVIPSPLGTWVGPTDLPGPEDPDEVRTTEEEKNYLLRSVTRYFPSWPQRPDSTIVGSRPILGQPGNEKLLSRDFEVFDHEIRDGIPGFMTIGGGKMSDYRVMAEAVTDAACQKLGVNTTCRTHLQTLEGQPIQNIPSFKPPQASLKNFLKNKPHLREMYALGYLGLGLISHLWRRLSGQYTLADEAEVLKHYE